MLRPGIIINDRYEIIEKVGSGGMADVYKAKCHKLNRYVAIKVLKSEFSYDKSFVNKFREEAQACAGLSHPNIVNIYDVGDEGDIHFIVMELVEGITLKEYIERKGKLEIKESVGIAIQIAKGMEAAHVSNIVHRDIKPQNIIISKEGKVKVTDFGIAKAMNSNTITANAMGSVHYLSPEQARGGYSDEKSDIYSLGVTLYEMLSGRVPFVGDNTVSVALLHIQSEPIPLRELDPDIPVSVERIVQKCMQKKPERRYLNTTDLINDLRKSIEDPNGNFVVMPAAPDLDSPTITMSDEELEIIKSASSNTMNSNGGYNDMNPKDNPNFHDDDFDDEYYEGDSYDDGLDEELEDDFLEDDADLVDGRMEKIVRIGTVIIVVIFAAIILVAITKFVDLFPKPSETPTTDYQASISPTPVIEDTPTPTPLEIFTMPYVVNLKYDDAHDLLKQRVEDIVVKSTEDFSDTVSKGSIMEQYPIEGTEITSQTEVRLVISAGKESFPLPNVVNYAADDAVTLLTDMDLSFIRDFQNHDEVEKGDIISTTPEQGTLVVKGDTIILLISNGPETKYVEVPDLTNMNEAEARNKLEGSGLSFGRKFNETEHSNREKGKVASQSHNPFTMVQEGTAIDIYLSIGPEPTPAETEPPTEEETDPLEEDNE